MNTWLITGGCGFIGSRLIQTLVSNSEDRIRVLDNFSVGNLSDLATVPVRFSCLTAEQFLAKRDNPDQHHYLVVKGDITDRKLVSAIAQSCSKIVHLAANTGVGPSIDNPRSDCLNNVIGTFNLLEAARQNTECRFVFSSSGAPVGEVSQPPIHEELPVHPVSPYGASKLAGEGYCSAYYHSFGVSTVALRFGNVYGPGSSRKQSVVAKFIRAALAGEPLRINGDGTQTRDFIYIDDLIKAVIAAASVKDISGEIFQIATNQESTVLELTDKLVACLEAQGIDKIELKHGAALVGDVKRNYSDISKARQKLGWNPETPLIEGLTKTVQYFKYTNK